MALRNRLCPLIIDRDNMDRRNIVIEGHTATTGHVHVLIHTIKILQDNQNKMHYPIYH